MIIDEIIIENFGVFRGRQSIRLTPESPAKPIILIGGLNGGGKTTLLDALQLALYGKFARCSNRGALTYEEYIQRSIHRGIAPDAYVSIELHFRRLMQGEEQRYIISRLWKTEKNPTEEQVRVSVNGSFDAALTEGWAEHVEAIVPQGVSTLFFFDGEKIEELATQKSAASVLSNAISSLLGLEIVDRLGTDLIALDRRKSVEAKSDADRESIRLAEREISSLEKLLENSETECATCQNSYDVAQRTLKEVEDRHRKEGGIYLSRQEADATKENELRLLIERKRLEFWTHSAGASPLALTTQLLSAIVSQATEEHENHDAQSLSETLDQRDSLVLSKLRKHSEAIPSIKLLERLLEEDRARRKPRHQLKTRLGIDRNSSAQIENLVKSVLPASSKRQKELRDELEQLDDAQISFERARAAVPEKELISGIVNQLSKIQLQARETEAALHLAEEKIAQLRKRIETEKAKLVRFIEGEVESKLKVSDDERMLLHIKKVRKTLTNFREAIITRHVKQIEHFVLECFQQLLHKASLVSEIRIDPQSYTLSLFGGDKFPLQPERLSAGERQILAVALLWGLARAAGRALPTFIDTPLGRLDADHRSHLINRYFPFASHQVVLLSTDKEIEDEYYKTLKPYITREYTLEYDDKVRFTKVQKGYFKD